MKKVLSAVLLTLIGAPGIHAQRGGGKYATPFAHVAVGTPLSNSANSYKTGIHGDFGFEIGNATAMSRLAWRATLGFARFGAKETNVPRFDITSGNVGIILALHPERSPVGVFVLGGPGFYQHKTRVQTIGLNLSRRASSLGFEGGLALRLLRKSVSPELQSRAQVIFTEGDNFTFLTVGIGVVVNRRGNRR